LSTISEPSVFQVVEGHARADDVEHGDAVVRQGGLDHFLDLLGVAGERRATKVARDQGFHADIDRQVHVGALFLEFEPLSAVAENWPLVRP
jgi:hypothetical protein